MGKDNFKNQTPTDVNNMLPDGVSKVDVKAKWECCKCGWIGEHSETTNKTPVINELYLLVCPKCGNKDEFYAFR
jgi:rubredoxin